MLSVHEKRDRLETLLERVKRNRYRLDEEISAGRAREPAESIPPSDGVAIHDIPVSDKILAAEPISEQSPAVLPAETVEQEVVAATTEQLPTVTPISTAEQEAATAAAEIVESETDLVGQLKSASTMGAGEQVEPQERVAAVAAAETKPAVETDDAAIQADDQSDIAPIIAHFEPAIEASDAAIEIKGRGPSSWTMKAVFDRAWTLGSRKDQS